MTYHNGILHILPDVLNLLLLLSGRKRSLWDQLGLAENLQDFNTDVLIMVADAFN